jgi:iron complex transport system permease protein
MKWAALIAAVLVTLLVAVGVGPTHVPAAEVLHSPIVWQLRVPRALLGVLVGGSLGVAGAGLQSLVRNPLADPFLLGLSGGASLGAVAAISLHMPGPWALPLAAFGGALLALGAVFRLGLIGGAELDPRVLLLGGVAIGAFCGAVTTAIVSLAEASELRNAYLWLWGGLSGASWTSVEVLLLYVPLPLAVLFSTARSLDLIVLGEEPARHLGAEVAAVKRRVYLSASLLTAAAVAAAGVIGFVGLIVPHLARALWGGRHRPLLPASFLAGAGLLVASDVLARVAAAPREIPVGIVTALLGVPLFILLLKRWTAY